MNIANKLPIKEEYQRQPSAFRNTMTEVEHGRYHLYVSHACPWAHRVLAVRSLLGLEKALSLSVVNPILSKDGWCLDKQSQCPQETYFGHKTLIDVYKANLPDYAGKATVPVLIDKVSDKIINNESSDIMYMLANKLAPLADHWIELYPSKYRRKIEGINQYLQKNVNEAVYKVGFARSTAARMKAKTKLFNALDYLETQLSKPNIFLLGNRLTSSDIRLWVTLIRFDIAYYPFLNCNTKKLSDYPNLSNYVENLSSCEALSKTINTEQIQTHFKNRAHDLNATISLH